MLWTLPIGIRFGKNSQLKRNANLLFCVLQMEIHLHCDCSVKVHESHDEKNPAEDDGSMDMSKSDDNAQEHGCEHDLLADNQPVLDVLHVVQHQVGKGRLVSHTLVGDDQGDGGDHHAHAKEKRSQQGFPWLVRKVKLLRGNPEDRVPPNLLLGVSEGGLLLQQPLQPVLGVVNEGPPVQRRS